MSGHTGHMHMTCLVTLWTPTCKPGELYSSFFFHHICQPRDNTGGHSKCGSKVNFEVIPPGEYNLFCLWIFKYFYSSGVVIHTSNGKNEWWSDSWYKAWHHQIMRNEMPLLLSYPQNQMFIIVHQRTYTTHYLASYIISNRTNRHIIINIIHQHI